MLFVNSFSDFSFQLQTVILARSITQIRWNNPC